MNRQIKKTEYFLHLLGYVNVSLIVLSISFGLVNIFPEREGFAHVYNSFGVLVPLWVLKYLAENVRNKWLKAIVLFSSFLSIPLAKGNVAATAWTVSLLVFLLPALYAPRNDGKVMMSRPRIWHVLVFLVMFGMGNITEKYSVKAMAAVMLYVFLLILALDYNLTGCMKKIRDSGESVDVESVLKANGKVILVYVLLFSILTLLLPSFLSLLSREGEKSQVTYEFWEEAEEEEAPQYVTEAKEKGISQKRGAIDYSGVGNVLLVVFILALGALVVLEAWVIVKRIMESGGRKEIHSDRYESEFSTEKIGRDKKEKKKEDSSYFSTAARIRRLYKKAVDRRRDGRDISFMTPGEIGKEYLKSSSSSVLTEIYSRTRYSSLPPDMEDLEKMKAAFRDEKSSK